MNRYLAIPFSISLLLFSGYLYVESTSQAATDATALARAPHSGFPAKLLTIDEAQEALVQDWYTQDSQQRLFTRARPMPAVYAFAKLDRRDSKQEQLFFTGQLHVVNKKQLTKVPVVVDRISASIFVFHVDKWLPHQDWLENHAPDRPAT